MIPTTGLVVDQVRDLLAELSDAIRRAGQSVGGVICYMVHVYGPDAYSRLDP